MFNLTIPSTANAAFADDGPSFEVARLLRESADKIENGQTSGKLVDYNGNIVGTFELTD